MNIYVGNLSYEVTEDELKQEFEAYGEVASVNIIRDKYSGQSRGFAFVEMPTLQQGQAALAGLNGKKLHERAISVSGARERQERGATRTFRNSRPGGNSNWRGGRSGGRR